MVYLAKKKDILGLKKKKPLIISISLHDKKSIFEITILNRQQNIINLKKILYKKRIWYLLYNRTKQANLVDIVKDTGGIDILLNSKPNTTIHKSSNIFFKIPNLEKLATYNIYATTSGGKAQIFFRGYDKSFHEEQ